MLRTHNCGELRKNNAGDAVKLCGWVASRRDHGEIIFMDLRDKYGITQIVFDPEKTPETHKQAHGLRNEYCIKIEGSVTIRPEGTVNPKISTGEVEIYVEKIEVFSESETTPFEIKDSDKLSEDVRLKYRYLDLRRPWMQRKITLKHEAFKYIYDFMDAEGFVSVETPILTKSTPEGARDYIVPSRVHPGEFYALPQSPQIFKQLLMVAGTEKYFQIARCFRDEDLRADRQPEFTQLDIEMSFITEEDIYELCERFFQGLFKKLGNIDVKIPFPRIEHCEAMRKYGSDKPDIRFDLFLNDLTNVVSGCDFKVFNGVVENGGKLIGIAAPGYAGISRKDIDTLTAFVGEYGAKGLAYFKVEGENLVSPITKFFSSDILKAIKEATKAKDGDMIFIVADSKSVAYDAMGALRLKIGNEADLVDRSKHSFSWIVDFPLFKFNKEDNRWVSEHHPFTSYNKSDQEKINTGDLENVRSRSYDLVLNGSEIGSGSIRIHQQNVQKKIFEILGLTEEECQSKFGFLLDAFKFGPPPHGGVAFGIDRLITLFTKDASIREVIPFPKTQRAICPLTEAPSCVDEKQLRDLGIKVKKKTE
ncbi:MAG: aspartate--tRNA ligase [Candidatus Omnitrophica bacterium]|nr:aspartate--tRNA ligase [Candidatus Omnitrophota bacterium]